MAKMAAAAAAVTDRIKILDLAVFILSLGMVTASIMLIVLPASGNRSRVEVRADGRIWRYSLDSELSFSVPGPLGDTIIHIHDGHAAIIESPCANQTCVHSPAVSRPGQWTACLPNAVFLLVEGETGNGEIDATSW